MIIRSGLKNAKVEQKMDLVFEGKLMHKNIRRIFLWDDMVGMRHVEGTDEKRICLWDAMVGMRPVVGIDEKRICL